jgi:hypothetical protein
MKVRAAAVATAIAVTALAGIAGGGCLIYLNPACDDNIRNGDETDFDCGGSCGPCDIGSRCKLDADCDEGLCKSGTCEPFACANSTRDNQETDVDCGGGECRKCAGGRKCVTDDDCFSGMCVAATKTCFSLPSVSFGPAVSYPSGSKTYILFSGDMNGDGSIDLVAGNEQDSTISVFLNNGTGAFQLVNPVFPTGDYPTGGTLQDFNHDGILDVITADYHGNSVSILFGIDNGMGKGTGALAPKSTFPTVPGGETGNLAVGDLNGDGNLDVIAVNPPKSSASQFMGRADGTLEPSIDIPVGIMGSSEPHSAAIGDFDGNGTDDVAIANARGGTILVRLGNGDGTLQPEVLYLEGGAPTYVLITYDINVDGKLDLVCANRSSDDVSVLLGRGDGTFRKAIVSSTGPDTGPYSIAVADFNLDGVPDVATANFKAGTASVLLGIGNGAFEAPIDAGVMGVNAYGTAAGDFNGDGKPDIATANASSNDVAVRLSTAH